MIQNETRATLGRPTGCSKTTCEGATYFYLNSLSVPLFLVTCYLVCVSWYVLMGQGNRLMFCRSGADNGNIFQMDYLECTCLCTVSLTSKTADWSWCSLQVSSEKYSSQASKEKKNNPANINHNQKIWPSTFTNIMTKPVYFKLGNHPIKTMNIDYHSVQLQHKVS